jgi:hypothetical protein
MLTRRTPHEARIIEQPPRSWYGRRQQREGMVYLSRNDRKALLAGARTKKERKEYMSLL